MRGSVTDTKFLPVSREDMAQRGWDELDIIMVSGDAYVDHPAWAAAILGRFLEHKGFRVGVIAQPDWRNLEAIRSLGPPRLFFAVSAGNMDSMVNHFTADKKRRHADAYSPGGQAGLRPDRATLAYTNLIRQAYPGIPVVIGGVEASLRRLAHYDYWSDQVRRSILVDSQADLLVYGMGEQTLWEIARRIKAGQEIAFLTNLRGTCYLSKSLPAAALEIPAFEEVLEKKRAFAQATKIIQNEINPYCARALAQKHGKGWVVQNPPALPLTTDKLDEIYSLPFARQAHPGYLARGGVPALKPVQFSLVTHRGCFGGCSFCSLGLHQGKFIQSRSPSSLVAEAKSLTSHPDFKGTIPDVGAASANMYGLKGKDAEVCQQCRRTSCLYPSACKNLVTDQRPSTRLWSNLRKIDGVKHIFVGSGIRYDLVLLDKSSYLRDLCQYHVSGQLKIAPEHVASRVIRLMHKPGQEAYVKFIRRFKQVNQELGKDQYLVPYFISAHPGSDLKATVELAEFVRDQLQYHPEQVQNFTPTPMTVSTCMFYTGLDPENGEAVYVPRQEQERKWQRALLQYRNRNNVKLVRLALQAAGRTDLIGTSKKALVRDETTRQPGNHPRSSKKPRK
ncbi:MAG: YgiQ family radical SAM protein [Syntrophomonadaceae bacterium]